MDSFEELNHSINNKIATLDNCLTTLAQMMPLLIDAYTSNSKNQKLTPHLLAAAPKLFDHAIKALHELEADLKTK